MKLQTYQFGQMTLTWLRGADKYTDAGTIFGPVPKAVWSRYYPTNEQGLIHDLTDPILISYQGKHYLIDTSLGTEKLSDKLRRNLGVISENRVLESLDQLGLSPEDIDVVLMTHMHNDHAGGLTRLVDGELVPTFPNATIYINDIEWEEVRYPNPRTRATYLPENWQAIQDQVQTFGSELKLVDGIEMHHTGGHSRGHSIILLKQDGETLIHMADTLLTHAHFNPLWVAAVDDYPMDSIKAKEKWIKQAYSQGYTFLFYHDPYYALLKFNQDGSQVVSCLERLRPPVLPFTDKEDKRLVVAEETKLPITY
ncbi:MULTISPECIES: MBL fold metallo-hydrolase [Streptococcus]|uniref:MBL fold metallo-hydrolase n=1 Tax=Streptococcus suis TaxID=1307 RepID=A0A3R8RDM8_STRSU|nr:MBL fold metallo-hydrolase [Streptococcus suis]RRR53932.1 MBL fold metallo-hydrolase [Streptococcus suis]